MNGRAEMPVFVKIDEYKDLMDILHLTREKVKKAKIVLDKIRQLKQQENAEIAAWENELLEVERRLSEIDRSLAEPEF